MAITDTIIITILIFAAVVGTALVSNVWFSISSSLENALDSVDTSTASDRIIVSTNVAMTTADSVLAFVMVAASLGVIALAYFIPTDPIFFIVAIMIAIVLFALAPPLANAFVDFATDPSMSPANVEARWPMTTFLMQRYPIYVLITAAGMLIALFAKPRE